MKKALARFGPDSDMQEFNDRDQAQRWVAERPPAPTLEPQTFFGVRGGESDGVYVDFEKEVKPRMKGKYTEVRSFASRDLAAAWIFAGQCFVVTYLSGEVSVTERSGVLRATTAGAGSKVLGPMPRAEAMAMAETRWDTAASAAASVPKRGAANAPKTG